MTSYINTFTKQVVKATARQVAAVNSATMLRHRNLSAAKRSPEGIWISGAMDQRTGG